METWEAQPARSIPSTKIAEQRKVKNSSKGKQAYDWHNVDGK